MNSEATTGTEETEHWNRVAMLVRAACAAVRREGKDILIKFDGGRDNDEIYTVVLDVARERAFRMDSSNLEDALAKVLEISIADVAVPADDFAELLHTFDLLARQGFIIGIRIQRDTEQLNFEAFLSREDKPFQAEMLNGSVFAEVAAEVIRQAQQDL